MSTSDAGPDRPRLGLKVTLLCIAGGSLDAVTVLAVGDAFASVMTGNIVLLGVAVGSADGARLAACILAILGYVLGGLIGSWLTHRSNGGEAEPVWPSRVTRTLAIEMVLLIGLAVAWLLEPEPGEGVKLALLAVAASAMGMQSSAVRAVKVPVSTTYLTGALTGVVEAIATRTRFSASNRNGLYGLIALLTGALAGGLTVHYLRPAALVLPAVAVATVVVISWLEHRRHH